MICLLLVVNTSKAQNLIDDLKAVSSRIDSAESADIRVICNVYTQKGGDIISTVNTGIIKKGKLSVSLFEEMEILTNDKYGVYVNKESQSITIISKSKHTSRLKAFNDKGIDQFVSWMKQQQKKATFNPVLISEEGSIRTYAVRNLDDNLKEVIVSVDVKQKKLLKISYEFSELSSQKQKYILLNYSKYLVNDSEIHLNQNDYYMQQSGKFLPGNKYKSYSITTDL